MESMNLLDITVRYFNVIVFVMCVIFGMTSLFASWIAWREIHRKKNIVRSILAAYNIAEDAQEKGRTGCGDFDLDPVVVQTMFNSLQEVLNAMYGEMTGKPIPPREGRSHGSGRLARAAEIGKFWRRKRDRERMDPDHATPALIAEDREHHRYTSHP